MRAQHSAPALRRRPTRAASKEIVRSILGAAALLLDRDGIRGSTTNAVARVAGVSVGSLYQYFPDIKAIIAELARGLEATALAIAAEEAVRMRDASARELTSRVVGLSCSLRFGTGRLRRILLREVPRGWTLHESRSTDAMVGAAITAFLATRSEVRQLALPRAVFVAQHAVEGLAEAVLLADPDALSTDAVQRELFHLAWAYLAEDGAQLERPPVGPIDTVEPADVADDILAERLLHEPSPRRAAVRARAASARALATRRALTDAAERVLARDGFAGLSVRAVVGEAGCAVGSFYRHFASPLAVAAEVAVQLEHRAMAALASGLDGASAPVELAGALVRAYAGEMGSLRRTLLAEVPRRSIDAAAAPVLHASIDELTRALSRCSRELRSGELELMAFFALHAVKSVTEAFVLLEPDGIDGAALQDALRELVACYWLRATPSSACPAPC